MNFNKDEALDPDVIVEWAKKQAEKAVENLDQEERVECIRRVVDAFIVNNVIDAENLMTSPTASFEAAAQTLYVCHLLPLLFSKAYNVVEQHLDIENKIVDDKEDVIESLHRSFDL